MTRAEVYRLMGRPDWNDQGITLYLDQSSTRVLLEVSRWESDRVRALEGSRLELVRQVFL